MSGTNQMSGVMFYFQMTAEEVAMSMLKCRNGAASGLRGHIPFLKIW